MFSMFRNTQATALDLSSFDTSNVTNINTLFYGSTNLKTIYVSDEFVTTKVTAGYGGALFTNANSLVGGAGTTYDANHVDKSYAHIDGGTSNPGYFTDIADKPNN